MVAGSLDPVPAEVFAAATGQPVVLKCLITFRGTVERCRVLQGLPPEASAVLVQHFETRRYEPAIFEGRPVDVDYTFHITIKAPTRKPPELKTVVEADPTLVLPPEVVDAAQGQTLTLRCLVTAEGSAEGCRTLEGPPAAAAAAARYLGTQRFRPMMLQDKPVSMERTFTFRFTPTQEAAPARN